MSERVSFDGSFSNVPCDSGVREMVRNWFLLASIIFFAAVAVGTVSAQPPQKKEGPARSPLLKEPTTPEDLFAATLLMVDLARLDLAAQYLEKFDESAPDDEMLIKLRDKYGTGDFLRLASSKELQPRSTLLLERLNAAAKKQANDPAFVDALIQRLTQGAANRDLAIAELRNAGVHVVPEILKQMSRPDMAAQQDDLVITLMRMGNQVIPPLIGALDSPQERIQAAIIEILGHLDSTEAIPYLWYPAFDENQPSGVRIAAKKNLARLLKRSTKRVNELSSVDASIELRRLAKLLYRKPDSLPLDDQGNITLWGWNEELGTVVEQSFTPEVATLFVSTRFARQSLALSPDQPEQQRQYLASLLGLEVLRGGWEKTRLANPGTAMYLGLIAGEETISQVLAEGLEAGRPATAVAALEILSQIGTREQLLSQKGMKSPLLAALNSPDSRVQFVAAVTVLKLDPKTGFRGSNRIVEILARAATDPERSRAIVIDADSTRASVVAGYLSDAGFEADVASTGRDGFEITAKSSGVEMVVVHVNCLRWDLNQTLANLRADARTAAVPIIIYGPSSIRNSVDRQVGRHAPAMFVAESANSVDFLGQFLPFVKSLKTPPLSPQERAQQKKAAIYWLATIGSSGLSRIFDVSSAEPELGTSVEDPDVAANALVALAGISTGSAQHRISDVALNPQAPEGIRELAANQLAFHIQHFGLLLTRDDVKNIHASWKNAESPIVKSALATVIGSLRPNATIIGERLQQFAVPTAN